MSVAEQWAERLRNTPPINRGMGGLCYVFRGNVKHCAVGVLCEMAVEAGVISEAVPMQPWQTGGTTVDYRYGGNSAFPPDEVVEWAGIDKNLLLQISRKNDQGMSWNKIADIIEQRAGTK